MYTLPKAPLHVPYKIPPWTDTYVSVKCCMTNEPCLKTFTRSPKWN